MTNTNSDKLAHSNYESLFEFDNSYARELKGFYQHCQPEKSAKAEFVYLNEPLVTELGLTGLKSLETNELVGLFVGNVLPKGAEPIAQAYAGHQFGHFSPQLGDGRALILGEFSDAQGRRYDLALKGSGRTPFSRGGDGKAALGPMLREVLIGEAMHAFGIASTRSLAVMATGSPVYRETTLPGAVLARVASSHIRIGTFEYFSARGEYAKVKKLADYCIWRHYPQLKSREYPYRKLLETVVRIQAELIAKWMSVGFIHGVMNTDNVSITGETIDYGPCAFMERYNPETVFSSIDHQGRYAYQNQPGIGQWNLTKFAETLLPILDKNTDKAIEMASEVLNGYPAAYESYWLRLTYKKLGLPEEPLLQQDSRLLLDNWLKLLEKQQVDFTLAWRSLADSVQGDDSALKQCFGDDANGIKNLEHWLGDWRQVSKDLLHSPDSQSRAATMRQTNPRIIPRNHHVEAALTAASDHGDLAPFERLLHALRQPFSESGDLAMFTEPAPAEFTQRFKTYCGT